MDDMGESNGDVMKRARRLAYQEAVALRPPLELDLGNQDQPIYRLQVSCPKCGGAMTHQAGCKPTATRITAMFYCLPCRHTWQFVGGLLPAFTNINQTREVLKAEDIKCGTEKGYQLHRRRRKAGLPGGEPCDECKAAHRKYENDRVGRVSRAS